MRQSSLVCHLADVHNIYQQAVVAEELIEEQDSKTYMAEASYEQQMDDATSLP